jgi:hypothetical protein
MTVAPTTIDDYVDIVRYLRDLGDDGAHDTASRRLMRAIRPDDGMTVASPIQGDTLAPIVLVAPSGTGKTTEFRQQARRIRASGRAAVFAEATCILASPEMDLDLEERAAFKGLLELAVLVEHLSAHGRDLRARHGKNIFVAVIDLLATPVRQSVKASAPPAAGMAKKQKTATRTTKKTAPKKASSRPMKGAGR